MSTRVLIVDDHPVVVDGLTAGLQAHGIEVVGSASSVSEARTRLAGKDIDVVLVDLRLPDGSGTELLDAARSADAPAFILLSSFSSAEYVEVAMQLGARGYLLKTAKTSDVVSAIRRVVAGLPAFTPEQIMDGLRSAWQPLSEREANLLERLIAGRSNDEIAGDLGISTKRVEAHLTRLYERYEVASRTELAVRAERDGWLELPRRGGTSRSG